MILEKSLRIKAAKKKFLEYDFQTHLEWTFKKNTGQKFIWSKHHSLMARPIQRLLDCDLKKNGKPVKNLGIFVPPRYSKTEMVKAICTMGFSRNPAAQFIYTSYSRKLAMKCSKEIKDVISADWYQDLWQVDIEQDTKSKELWETKQGGGFYATSFGGAITGFGAGKVSGFVNPLGYKFEGALIIDDPLKVQDRFRKVALEDCIDYYSATLPSRKNSNKTPTILIMQRVCPNDLAGWIMNPENGEVDDWVFVELDAIVDEDKQIPLWPEKHNWEDLMKLAKNNEMFMAQYRQKPILLGGNIIKTNQLCRHNLLPALAFRWIEVDTALKDEDSNDYTVFQCWGKGYDGKMYLIDQIREKMLSIHIEQRLCDFWFKHSDIKTFDPRLWGYLRVARVEDKQSGTNVIQSISSKKSIPVEAVPRNQRSKFERVVDLLLPALAISQISIPVEASWVSDFITECQEFSQNDADYDFDDQVDTLTSAVEYGYGQSDQDNSILNSNKKIRK